MQGSLWLLTGSDGQYRSLGWLALQVLPTGTRPPPWVFRAGGTLSTAALPGHSSDGESRTHTHPRGPGPAQQGAAMPWTRLHHPSPCRVLPTQLPLSTATRESAFVHAIASAGVAFAVTRSCAEGSAAICGCSSRHQGSPGEGWKWGGCSEDIEFGGMVSREFADARENRPDARSAMNRHNNEAGRQVCCLLLAGPGGTWSGECAGDAQGVRVLRSTGSHPSRPCASCGCNGGPSHCGPVGLGGAPSDHISEVLGR